MYDVVESREDLLDWLAGLQGVCYGASVGAEMGEVEGWELASSVRGAPGNAARVELSGRVCCLSCFPTSSGCDEQERALVNKSRTPRREGRVRVSASVISCIRHYHSITTVTGEPPLEFRRTTCLRSRRPFARSPTNNEKEPHKVSSTLLARTALAHSQRLTTRSSRPRRLQP